jgi:hypothetical protein
LSGPRPIRLQLSPSHWLAVAILGANGLAAACLFAVLPFAPGIGAGTLLLALGLATARDRAWLAGRSAVRAIELSGSEQITLETADGKRQQAPVGARRFVNRLFVSIPVRISMRRTILVTADMLDEGQFRALRVWALWGRVPGAMTPQAPA